MMSLPLHLLDAESKAAEAGVDHKAELRLWLRLLTCANMVERDIRRRLRDEFETTLPRFDLLAQLERAPKGLTLGEVSRRMMVSNGNVTGLVDRLVESGHLERFASPDDRRNQLVRLTPFGRSAFARMATAHETWIAELFRGLSPADIDKLMNGLGRLKISLQAAVAPMETR
jgi:DNA-binding MarR family transcriptional regulator